MPRDGFNIYSAPAGTNGVPQTPIESAKYNAFVADIVADQNNARPITAGGTGAATAIAAADALSPNGGSIASASTVNLANATGTVVTITGTTTITALGTVAAGARRVLVFAGSLTLTHNGTSLILPGGANIQTSAGDVFEFVSLGSGNWRCVRYLPAAGLLALTGGTLTGPLNLTIGTAPADPAAGLLRLYALTGGLLSTRDENGVESVMWSSTNLPAADTSEMEAGTETDQRAMSPADVSDAIAALESSLVVDLGAFSNVAQIDIDLSAYITAGFKQGRIDVETLVPATNNVSWYMRVSTNGGSSFLTSDYVWHNFIVNATTPGYRNTGSGGLGTAGIELTDAINNTVQASAIISFFCGVGAFFCTAEVQRNVSSQNSSKGYKETAGVNAIRLYMSSGNISSARVKLVLFRG